MSEHTPTAQDALREIAKFEGDVKYAWLLQEAANKLDANADLLRINKFLVKALEDIEALAIAARSRVDEHFGPTATLVRCAECARAALKEAKR